MEEKILDKIDIKVENQGNNDAHFSGKPLMTALIHALYLHVDVHGLG